MCTKTNDILRKQFKLTSKRSSTTIVVPELGVSDRDRRSFPIRSRS